ncbi:vWA domain-containing protein [Amaricoccus sp.]|uniref:vWA domain-containing protein n=1 Tax=Amaricoccus sp. TaxID=1872485 RepID=UPI001B49F11E|nr:vWA domain-containing protein [Amaricoccus sp.]MBP7000628.1 VWA domain-containing protein [Amaricoccus sp.]
MPQRTMPPRNRHVLARLGVAAAALAALLSATPASAQFDPENEPDISWMNQPIASIDGFFPTPWACTGVAPVPQNVLHFHLNWHCTNPDNTGPNWGARFLGFHRQFLRGYERFSAAMGYPNIQTFNPGPGAIIGPTHNGRPANTPCNGVNPGGGTANCQTLPNAFREPAAGGTLDTFASEAAIGDAVVGYHNNQHTRIGYASTAAGGFGECVSGDGTTGLPDIRCNAFAPRDPIFYRYHNLYNDVQDNWRRLQPADVMIVFDRSGSMTLPTAGGGTRLVAAKNAANLFADLLENGGGSRVGLVSFSSAAASPVELGLTGPGAAPAAMAAALTPIVASGTTSIGAGLQAAMTTLAASARPAILLLTDGIENTAPTIAAVQGSLDDAHVCAVGLGTAGSLDGPKLRDLAELQGGIYVSGPGDLELRKFFVDCFADIFDTFVGMDPIVAMEPADAASAPVSQSVLGDRELVFVGSWSQAVPPGELRLQVTAPSGKVVDLSDPTVESAMNPLWHVVRFPLPLAGEGDGVWKAQAVRGPRSFANGFTGDSFVDEDAGIELIRRQIRTLCPAGCANVLYYEDEMPMTTAMSFQDHNSIYAQALFYEVPVGTVTNVSRIRDAHEFTALLKRGGFDLIVYASKVAQEVQPYDEPLARILCDPAGPPAIVSDSRATETAAKIWGCVGAKPTGEYDWDLIAADGVLLEQDQKLAPYMKHGHFSFGLAPAEPRASEAAKNSAGSSAIVQAATATPPRQELFINILTEAPARVLPHPWRSTYYTGEELHPTFQIPETSWPPQGFDSIKAKVLVTRPLNGLGALAVKGAGQAERKVIEGDVVGPREAALLAVDPKQTGEVIGAETLEFELFDDGTHGDGVAGDHYWEAALPADVAKVDGEYEFHAIFELCRGGVCVTREARHKAPVDVKADPRGSDVTVERPSRTRAEVYFTPRDANGGPVGPGLADRFLITTSGGARLIGIADARDPGTYRIDVEVSPLSLKLRETAVVRIAQFGRPKEALVIPIRR